MDCQHIMYKSICSTGPYDRYLVKQKQKQISQKKELFYFEIFKFAQSRYPKEFLLQLQRQINPFEHSLETMRQIILRKYPDLTEDVVNESVEYVFGKKSREALMIKQSPAIIEDGDQYIKNGRKLVKQDFSYFFQKPLNDTLPLEAHKGNQSSRKWDKSERGSNTKRSNTSRQDLEQKKRRTSQHSILQSQRPLTSSPRRNLLSASKNQMFNQFIAEQIQKQNKRYKNIDIIYEDDPDDILVIQQFKKKPGFTDRSLRTGRNNESFPNFKQNDIVVHLQGGIETGRSDVQQLNHLLEEVTVKCEQKEGLTQRSDRGMHMMKISKKNMQNLYNIKGELKIETIKRAANRMINQFS